MEIRNKKYDSYIARHPAYPEIFESYMKLFKERKGKMNENKFFLEVVLPRIPGSNLASWYSFVHRFKTKNGIPATPGEENNADVESEEEDLEEAARRNEETAKKAISVALNIGRMTLHQIMKDPSVLEELPLKDRIAFIFKAIYARNPYARVVPPRNEEEVQEKLKYALDSAAAGLWEEEEKE